MLLNGVLLDRINKVTAVSLGTLSIGTILSTIVANSWYGSAAKRFNSVANVHSSNV
jgi:hypothetical protein